MSHAYSVHTFSGMLGSAAAPIAVLFMYSQFGWRGAFFGAAILGAVFALIVFLQRDAEPHPSQPKPHNAASAGSSWQLLLSRPILINLLFFMLLSLSSWGLLYYSVVALGALHGTPAITANGGLSAYLICSAAGVLLGGWVASRTTHHGLVAGLCLGLAAAAVLTLGFVDLGAVPLVAVMSFAGLCTGIVMPSRDMLVRAVTPPGAFGKVFGFVTNGFNIAGIAAPMIFAPLMDHGAPRVVFIVIAVCSAAAVLTVVGSSRQRPAT